MPVDSEQRTSTENVSTGKVNAVRRRLWPGFGIFLRRRGRLWCFLGLCWGYVWSLSLLLGRSSNGRWGNDHFPSGLAGRLLERDDGIKVGADNVAMDLFPIYCRRYRIARGSAGDRVMNRDLRILCDNAAYSRGRVTLIKILYSVAPEI